VCPNTLYSIPHSQPYAVTLAHQVHATLNEVRAVVLCMLRASETGDAWQVKTGHLQQVRLTQGTQQGMTVCSASLTYL